MLDEVPCSQATVHEYAYDAEGKLISSAFGATRYIYDAEGNRVAKQNYLTGVITNQYLYDTAGRMTVEIDGSGNVLRQEIYAGNRYLGTLQNGTMYYSHANWLGTDSARSDSGGLLCQTSGSLPFGDALQVSGNCFPSPKFYTGKERDTESGLDYFGARYYGSSMGRWMSPDWADKPEALPYSSLDNPQSLNLYGYVLNNPLSKADADGHWPDCSWCSNAWSGVTGVVGGVLNVIPQTINAAGQLQNAMMSPFTSYRVDMLPEIQADAHTSQTGLDIGNAAATAYPLAAAAVEVRTAGMVVGEVRAATAGEAAANAAVPESIPAGPGARPSPTQQGAINQMGDAHGCSTCTATSPGTKTGNWVGDHQPPTKLNPTGGPQVYKPQCLQCSRQQGGQVAAAVKAAKKAETPQ